MRKEITVDGTVVGYVKHSTINGKGGWEAYIYTGANKLTERCIGYEYGSDTKATAAVREAATGNRRP